MAITSPIQTSATVGTMDVLISGIVHLESFGDLTVNVNDLLFRFEFKTDAGIARYVARLDGEAMVFDLFNHNNSLGEGMLTPIEVATMHGRTLYMTYFVTTIGTTNFRSLQYVFLLGQAK